MAIKKEVIKKFATEVGNTIKQRSNEYWAEKYSVSGKCIARWLEIPWVKEIVDNETRDYNDVIRDRARNNVNIALRELKKIAKMDKMSDVKRKACVDIISLAKGDIVKSDGNKKEKNKKFDKMTDKGLNSAYEKLLGNNRRKKTDNSTAKESSDKTIN